MEITRIAKYGMQYLFWYALTVSKRIAEQVIFTADRHTPISTHNIHVPVTQLHAASLIAAFNLINMYICLHKVEYRNLH